MDKKVQERLEKEGFGLGKYIGETSRFYCFKYALYFGLAVQTIEKKGILDREFIEPDDVIEYYVPTNNNPVSEEYIIRELDGFVSQRHNFTFDGFNHEGYEEVDDLVTLKDVLEGYKEAKDRTPENLAKELGLDVLIVEEDVIGRS